MDGLRKEKKILGATGIRIPDTPATVPCTGQYGRFEKRNLGATGIRIPDPPATVPCTGQYGRFEKIKSWRYWN